MPRGYTTDLFHDIFYFIPKKIRSISLFHFKMIPITLQNA